MSLLNITEDVDCLSRYDSDQPMSTSLLICLSLTAMYIMGNKLFSQLILDILALYREN